MASYSVTIYGLSSYTPSISQAYYNTEYNFNTYQMLYVGDTFTVTAYKVSSTYASGFKYTSAVLDGFTQTSKTMGSKTVYGMTGTLTEAHLGAHYGTMAKATGIASLDTGQKFNYTVYGKYKSILAYNANGGSGAPGSNTITVDSTTATPTISQTVSTTSPTKSNATFKGWATSSSASSAAYVGGNTINCASSLSGVTTTLYAVYWTNWKAYLAYNANTGTGAPSTQSATVTQYAQPSAKSFTISSTKPTLSGYVFKGWSTTKYTPGTGTANYQPGGSISVAYSASGTTTTLYAVWAEEAKCNIKVNGVWKKGIGWVKVNGVWKKGKTIWINVGGTWKKGK